MTPQEMEKVSKLLEINSKMFAKNVKVYQDACSWAMAQFAMMDRPDLANQMLNNIKASLVEHGLIPAEKEK